MKLYHVVAMAKNHVIGKDNKLPWHFPEDLKHFKNLTSGHTIIMGRKTFESIGRALPNRRNIVLSRKAQPSKDNVEFFTSLEEALKTIHDEKAFIIGGAKIYEETIDSVDGIYATMIDQDYEGDAFYPEIPNKFIRKESRDLLEEPKIEAVFLSNSER